MSQQGKVALVTGEARGIGRSFVKHLLAEGAFVAICDSRKDVSEAAVEELSNTYSTNVIFFPCDVTNDEQFEECVKATIHQFGGLDILINNADAADEWIKPFRFTVDVNLNAVICGTRLGFKYMSKEEGGRGGIIVNVASTGSLQPSPAIPVYSATKAAVNQLSMSYGHEFFYKKSGVKVIAVNPETADTPLIDIELKHYQAFRDIYESFKNHVSQIMVQNPDSMGKGLIQVLQEAENGSLWTIKNDEPPKLTDLPQQATTSH